MRTELCEQFAFLGLVLQELCTILQSCKNNLTSETSIMQLVEGALGFPEK